jgi:GTP-binding protein
MLKVIEAYPPPATKGKYVKIKYCMQLPTKKHHSLCFANMPQYVKEPYKRYLENKIRDNWDFSGVPIDIYIREK